MPCSVAGSTAEYDQTSNWRPYFGCEDHRPRSRSDSLTCVPSRGPTAVTSSLAALTGPRPAHYLSGVRTWFEIEETDVYLAARGVLLRRCGAWAAARSLAMAPSLAEALLDARHFSADGRPRNSRPR